MSKNDVIEVQGTASESLLNVISQVELENGHKIPVHIPEKLRMNFIRTLSGDKATIEFFPYGLTRGRITRRVK